jgi:hypothetical protein
VQNFITTKVPRLWRRPLTNAEVTSLTNIYTSATANPADGGAPHGFDLLLQTVLQAPSFLFRSELGTNPTPPFRLDAYELAAAVSFLFTDSAPDDPLWSKAVNGTLSSPDVLASEVDRLMALPSGQDTLARYLSYWLWIERVVGRQKDIALFPEYTTSLEASVYESGFQFVKDVSANGTLSDLFTSSKVYVNREMSSVYGIPGGTGTTPDDLQAVTTAMPERSAGILTQPALLVATNKRPGVLDPIRHGLFVLEDLLGGGDVGQIGSPPPGFQAVADKMHGTEREQANQRAMTMPCMNCHRFFDPYGLTRSRYDAIGRYSATRYVFADNTVMPATYSWVESPTPIDASTTVLDLVGPDLKGKLADPAALARQLKSDGVRKRVAYAAGRTLVMYAMGYDSNVQNPCALRDVKEHFYQTGSFTTFFKDLVIAPGFAQRVPSD